MKQYSYQTHVTDAEVYPQSWSGKIAILDDSHGIEAAVEARGSSFHLLIGKHRYGNYICIPNWGIGTELAGLSDRFWNLENLSTEYPDLSIVDAASIADAVKELSRHYPSF